MKEKSTPLNIATLRLSGDDAALDEVILKLGLNVVWRVKAGDPRRHGGIHATAGLNSTIADGPSPGDMLRQVRSFLAACLKHRPPLFSHGVGAELSIGIAVGDSIQYVASVDLSPGDISDLATLGIALNFTAYPTSDEANNARSLMPES